MTSLLERWVVKPLSPEISVPLLKKCFTFGIDIALNPKCNDGGEGSHDHLCSYGTDCSDCGPRLVTAPPPPPSPAPSMPPIPEAPPGMQNLCVTDPDVLNDPHSRDGRFYACWHGYINNGYCDDGGPGSDYDYC